MLISYEKINSKQFILGKGLTSVNPIEKLSVSAMYNFMRLFHFENVSRKTQYLRDGFVDKIKFKHFMSTKEINIYFHTTRKFKI